MKSRLFVLSLTVVLLLGCQSSVDEYSSFERIGIVEGFYGTPWSHQDRLDILAFMGRTGMNAYFYAPKDDPFHRERWRDPYRGPALRRFSELLEAANKNRVDLYFALNPGLSIVYSSERDLEALTRKLDAMHQLGVKHFALFLDDVPLELISEEDTNRFKNLAEAHIYLINRTAQHISRINSDLVICPTTYTSAWGDRSYVELLGKGIDAEIEIFWTGPDVVAPSISRNDAREWANLILRPPLIWDNYPANDFADWRLFLGPLVERDIELSEEASGIISNPMNLAHASMIPLGTVARYAQSPSNYNPSGALRETVQSLYPREVALNLKPFLEIYSEDVWGRNLFDPLFIPGDPIQLGPVEKGLSQLETSIRNLQSDRFLRDHETAKLVSELKPIVERTRKRLTSLMEDPRYAAADGVLTYRVELDEYTPPPLRQNLAIDGVLDEWSGTDWKGLDLELSSSLDSSCDYQCFQSADALYFALKVVDRTPFVPHEGSVGDGDHVSLLMRSPNDSESSWVTLIPRDGTASDVQSGVLSARSFMGRVFKGDRDLIFEEFFASLLEGLPIVESNVRIASQRNMEGYTVEIAIPKASGDRTYVNLVVVDLGGAKTRLHSLARRNYPANTDTYAVFIHQ